MEVASPSPPPTKSITDDKLTEISTNFSKLKFSEEGEEEIQKFEESVELNDEEEDEEQEQEQEQEEEEEEEEEEEFSFACVNTDEPPITADEAFENGKIRPVFPLFNRSDLLLNEDVLVNDEDRPRVRKLFVDGELLFGSQNADVSYDKPRVRKLYVEDCNNRTSDGVVAEQATSCRKSNSTGFSKLWRFRDLVMRSNSDGRDAFVFLNNGEKTQSQTQSSEKKKKKGKEKTTSSEKKTEKKKGKEKSGIEKLYERNREKKEEGRHRSYLPYKQVGFFTNVNGLSRNIHPF